MVSEAQKRSRDKWDKDNMTVISCKLKKEDADRFKAACEEAGLKPNAVLQEYILSYPRVDKTAEEDL